MQHRVILTFLLSLAISHSSYSVPLDSLKARDIMARVDSIYNRIPDEEKGRMSFYPWAGNSYKLVQEALDEWECYDFLLRTFGPEIMSIYMDADAIEDPEYYFVYGRSLSEEMRARRYPLSTAPEGSGSKKLYYIVQQLTANFCTEVAHRLGGHDCYAKSNKPFDVRDVKPIVELHNYPPEYAYLAEKDTVLFRGYSEEERLQRLVAEKRRLLGSSHPCYALALCNLAKYYGKDSTDRAIRLQKEALAIYRSLGSQPGAELSSNLAARQLSHYYYNKCEGIRGKKWQQKIDLKQEEIDALAPVLAPSDAELKAARSELDTYKRLLASQIRDERNRRANLAYHHVDSIYRQLPDLQQKRIYASLEDLTDRNFLFSSYYHYTRMAILGKQAIDSISAFFGPAAKDSLLSVYMAGWRMGFYSGDKKKTLIQRTGLAMQIVFSDKWNISYEEAAAVAEAHRYSRRHSSFAALDDSLALLFYEAYHNRIRFEDVEAHAKQLLRKKQHILGKQSTGYGLTLCDLSAFYTAKGIRLAKNHPKRDSLFAMAVKTQEQAMEIYRKSQPECLNLATCQLAKIYQKWADCYNLFDDDKQRRNHALEILRDGIESILPILGDSSNEVKECRATIEELLKADENLRKRRHETLYDSWFSRAMQEYNAGNYISAKNSFQVLYEDEIHGKNSYRFLHIRGSFVRQWLAECYLQLGDTTEAYKQDRFYALPPVDRTKTLEIDYLCTFEPETPGLLDSIRCTFTGRELEMAHYLAAVVLQTNAPIQQAATWLLEARSICRRELGDNHQAVAQITWGLGYLYDRAGFYRESVDAFEETLAIESQCGGRRSPLYTSTLRWLDDECEKLGDKKRQTRWKIERLENDTLMLVHTRLDLLQDVVDATIEENRGAQKDSVALLRAINYLKELLDTNSSEGLTEPQSALRDTLKPYINRRVYDSSLKIQMAQCRQLLGERVDIDSLEQEVTGWLIDMKERRWGDGTKFSNIDSSQIYGDALLALVRLYYRLVMKVDFKDYERSLKFIGKADSLLTEYDLRITPLGYSYVPGITSIL